MTEFNAMALPALQSLRGVSACAFMTALIPVPFMGGGGEDTVFFYSSLPPGLKIYSALPLLLSRLFSD
jgi:hypothetical protein